MLLFAKTTWLRRLVQERHGVPMHAVKPSLDHDVFSPCERDRSAAEPVRIAAMIRPATPRRQPAETMDTLDALAWRFRERAAFHIFGASDEEIAEHGLTPDFPVVNHGRLIREEVAALLRSVDGFLDLSRYQAFGRSGLEAMACGCAVVLPAAGGVAEYAVPGENALLVDTSDGDACERAAAALIRDAALRQRLQRAGIATAERYSVFQAALSEVALFRDALTSRRG
jgi:glycosyltransferase involved in cell wall biosynthesis